MLIFATMINDVDDRAFMQEVYQQNERLMYAIALKYASNTQDCEDIVHDTVEKLCKNIAKIKGLPNSALRAYVVYAVRNTAINFRKHQSTIPITLFRFSVSALYLKPFFEGAGNGITVVL